VTPVEALERIVYLLDRAHAPSYRVRAFLNAARVVAQLDPAELAERAATGRLTELPGIGDVTAGVITEALAGQVPSYLAKLDERDEPGPGSPESAALRAALKGDCHLHSTWSDGGADIRTMATAAMALGHEYIVLTDHSPRLTVAHGLDRERLEQQLEEVAELNAELAPFRILTGIEVDIFEDGALDADEDMLERLDVVVASVHAKLRMDERAMTERMVLAVSSPHVDILGHCTGRLLPKRPPSRFDAELVFAACARFDTAVEINCRPERLDPPTALLRQAMEAGCRFAIDTDAHAPGQLEWLYHGTDRAAAVGLPPERVVNTWGADDLVAWTEDHPRW